MKIPQTTSQDEESDVSDKPPEAKKKKAEESVLQQANYGVVKKDLPRKGFVFISTDPDDDVPMAELLRRLPKTPAQILAKQGVFTNPSNSKISGAGLESTVSGDVRF